MISACLLSRQSFFYDNYTVRVPIAFINVVEMVIVGNLFFPLSLFPLERPKLIFMLAGSCATILHA